MHLSKTRLACRYDLFVRPDTCNPRIRFWFHFSVENVQRGQRVIFNIVNLSKVGGTKICLLLLLL